MHLMYVCGSVPRRIRRRSNVPVLLGDGPSGGNDQLFFRMIDVSAESAVVAGRNPIYIPIDKKLD